MRQKGFTLIELMIVVVVVATLAAVAIPSYREYTRKGRRADAVQALGNLQLSLEQWKAENPSFAGCASCDTSDTDYYDITLTANATSYEVTADPIGNQSGDRCGQLSMTNTEPKPHWGGDDDCNM